MRFRPKHNSGGSAAAPFAPAPQHNLRALRDNKAVVILVVLFLLWVTSPLQMARSLFGTTPKYPEGHPYGSRHVEGVTSRFIYPAIEDVDVLRQIGSAGLFSVDAAKNIKSLNTLDDPKPEKQKVKEEAENAASDQNRVRNHFKNHEKLVFRPKSNKDYPKVVIVSAVDFDKYSMESLATIVQNRVNYGYANNYGVYVRYYQEFCAVMQSLQFFSDAERKKWARVYTMRAAMFAFPHAQWFWYLDEDALIMNGKVDLMSYLLDTESLRGALLREQPVAPPHGSIRTYKNLKPENVNFLFTQSADKLETNSFVIKNNEIGRAILDVWTDPLFLNYNSFPYGPDSAISHILQWHPFLLSKTGIIKGRTINSLNSDSATLDPKTDHTHYFPGDLVAQWSTCDNPKACTSFLQKFSKKDSQ